MKMKQVLATGVALSMALSMAPVTASAADKVDINVIAAQYGQQTADWWANFVTEFNEANPDINLNVEVVSWNDIYTVVNTRIANGEAPDVLNIDVFADYQADDLLLPIQDVVSEETYSKMYDAFLAQSEVDGTVWAIPDLASARAMYYNKDILDRRAKLQLISHFRVFYFYTDSTESIRIILVFRLPMFVWIPRFSICRTAAPSWTVGIISSPCLA